MLTTVHLGRTLLGLSLLLVSSWCVAQTEASSADQEAIRSVSNHLKNNPVPAVQGPTFTHRHAHQYAHRHYHYAAHYSYNKPTYARLGVDFDEKNGAVVLTAVSEEAPAGLAGLQTNDRIISFAGIKVTSINQFTALIQHHNGGETVQVVYQRDGQVQQATITLATVQNQRHRTYTSKLPCEQIEAVEGRPFLGIFMNSHDDEEQASVLITSVIANTGAARSDLAQGDRIIAMDGQRTKRYREVRDFIRSHQPGDNIRVEVLRDGKVTSIPATIGHWGESQEGRRIVEAQADRCVAYNDPEQACGLLQQYTGSPYLGIYMSRNEADNGSGTLITSVIEGTAAQRAQLMGGDRIVRMNDTPIRTFEDAITFIDQQQPGTAVTIEYVRGDQSQRVQATMGSIADKDIHAPHVAHLKQVCGEQDKETPTPNAAPSSTAISPAPNVQLFPNPSRTTVNVTYESTPSTLQVTITNLEGKVLYNRSITQFDGQYNEQIDVSNFSPGAYFIRFVQDDGVVTKQLIVQ